MLGFGSVPEQRALPSYPRGVADCCSILRDRFRSVDDNNNKLSLMDLKKITAYMTIPLIQYLRKAVASD